MIRALAIGVLIFLFLSLFPGANAAEPPPKSAEARAVSFLVREVPRWARENRCFSCHNNGDAARALCAAIPAGLLDSSLPLAETMAWLGRPDRWDKNGGEGPFSDKRLARIQFAASLAAASEAGLLKDRAPLIEAGRRLAQDQAEGGWWPLEGEDDPGSPATYGRFLATYMARQSLQAADPARFRQATLRADQWLVRHEVVTVMDASVMLMVAASCGNAAEPRLKSLELLRKGQSDDGGWGPFVAAPPEPFDTALALIALSRSGGSPQVRNMIKRGRTFLIARQQDDGSWTETTRPAGGVSYAQQISTSGWATMALIATIPRSARRGTDPDR